jgi:NitT/TauT family transport system permease protein
LSLSVILPINLAAEIASIVLIFTSQVWNMTFGWYQSLTTIPKELGEASSIFRLNSWMQFKKLELPFATISLVWNSMMSWAGGWFFLMAAEIFVVGERDFRLPGLGAYLQEAANQSNFQAILWGVGTLVLVIVALDQLIWRPLLAWSDRFKVETVESDQPPTSWFYNALHSSRLLSTFGEKLLVPLSDRMDLWLIKRFQPGVEREIKNSNKSWLSVLVGLVFGVAMLYGVIRVITFLVTVPGTQWASIALGVSATTLRVAGALLIALAWTIPVGVAIGTNRRMAAFFQPVIQITASVPATALFPIFLLFVLGLPGGLNIAAVLLMLMGTQWYLLFNIIAGANAIPQDLKYTTTLIQLSRRERWKTLILPALFPYLVTGAITASGGAWNASIVAEHVHFGGETIQTVGIGALIAEATAKGDYALLLAATLSMVLAVILINRLLWRRLYRVAEEKYRME